MSFNFARFKVFPRTNIKKRFLWTFLMDLLDIRRRDVWKVHGWLHLSWFGISASSVIFKLREFSSDHLAPSLIFFHLQWYYDSLPYLNHMLRARYIGMSLATVLCECSLNHWFCTSLFVSLVVHREAQQIFISVNTEYRANLVKTRVNVTITLLHI